MSRGLRRETAKQRLRYDGLPANQGEMFCAEGVPGYITFCRVSKHALKCPLGKIPDQTLIGKANAIEKTSDLPAVTDEKDEEPKNSVWIDTVSPASGYESARSSSVNILLQTYDSPQKQTAGTSQPPFAGSMPSHVTKPQSLLAVGTSPTISSANSTSIPTRRQILRAGFARNTGARIESADRCTLLDIHARKMTVW